MTTPTTIRALVLEDRPADAMLMIDALRHGGFDPVWERVDTEADFAARLDSAPEIILSDFSLPLYSGLQALRLVRSRGLDVPFILVSGTIGEEVAVEAIRSGIDDYVMKDRMVRLPSAVRHALEQRRLRLEAAQLEEKRRAMEARFRALVENSFDAVSMLEADGTVIYRSPAAVRVLGYPLDELYRQNGFDLVHPDDVSRATALFGHLLAYPAERTQSVLRYLHKDGGWRWLEGNGINLLAEPGVGAIVINYRDVTEQRQVEEKVKRLSRVHAVMSNINASVLRVRDRDELFREACRIAVAQGNFGIAWVGTLDPDTQEVTTVARAGLDTAGHLDAATASARADDPRGQGVVGRAIRQREPVFENDIAADPGRAGARQREAILRGYQSRIALPLCMDGVVVGVLVLYARERDFFTDDELALLDKLASNLSFAVEHIAGRQKIEKLSRVRAVSGAINAAIVRARDRDTLMQETCRVAIEHGGFRMMWIGTLDRATMAVAPVVWAGMDDAFARELRIPVHEDAPRPQGTVPRAVREGRTVWDNDFAAQPDLGRLRRYAAARGIRSAIAVPLRIEDEIAGAVALYADEPGFFTRDEIQLIEEVIGNVALALAHIERQRKVDRLARVRAMTAHINAAIVRCHDRQALYDEACRIAVEQGKFGIAWIGALDAERQELTPVASAGFEAADPIAQEKLVFREGMPQRNGILGVVVLERRPVCNNDIAMNPEVGGKRRQEALRRGYRSAISLPLVARDQIFGTLSLFAAERNFFDDEEVGLLIEVATNISLAVEHIAQRERIEALSFARETLADSLRGANERLHQIYQAMPGAVMVFGADGVVKSVNDAAARLFGYAGEALVGQPLSRVFEPGQVPATAEFASLAQGDTVFRAEKQCRDSAGERIPVLYSATRLPGTGGGGHEFICVALDLREQKQLESELAQAQKLESVGRLAAGIAHEINTPIQFVGDSVHFAQEAMTDLARLIETYRQALREIAAGAPAAAAAAPATAVEQEIDLEYLREHVPKSLERVLDGVTRVADIVRAMKDFAHPDQKEMVPVDLNQAILNTLTIARNEYKYVAEVETDLSELPQVTCHPGEINQAILNIVVNAAHAIGETVANTELKGLIQVSTRCEGENVQVAISDTGGGIPAAIRDRVFDPFFTTKEVGRGTGQGLAIARAVIREKHGGDITFDTRPGKGTTFFIRLPVHGAIQHAAEEHA